MVANSFYNRLKRSSFYVFGVLLSAGIYTCEDGKKKITESTSFFESKALKDLGFPMNYLNLDTNSIYIYRPGFEYGSASCLQIKNPTEAIYYELDLEPSYYSNSRHSMGFASGSKNKTVKTTYLSLKTNPLALKKLAKHEENSIAYYREYIIINPKDKTIVEFHSRAPKTNYSEKEIVLIEWLKKTMIAVSYKEQLYFNLFMNPEEVIEINRRIKEDSEFFKKTDGNYAIPNNDIELFITGSIFQK